MWEVKVNEGQQRLRIDSLEVDSERTQSPLLLETSSRSSRPWPGYPSNITSQFASFCDFRARIQHTYLNVPIWSQPKTRCLCDRWYSTYGPRSHRQESPRRLSDYIWRSSLRRYTKELEMYRWNTEKQESFDRRILQAYLGESSSPTIDQVHIRSLVVYYVVLNLSGSFKLILRGCVMFYLKNITRRDQDWRDM